MDLSAESKKRRYYCSKCSSEWVTIEAVEDFTKCRDCGSKPKSRARFWLEKAGDPDTWELEPKPAVRGVSLEENLQRDAMHRLMNSKNPLSAVAPAGSSFGPGRPWFNL